MREMKITAIPVFLLLLVTHNLCSEDMNTNLHAPFVSRLSAKLNGSEVILNWRDSPDSSDMVYEIRRYKDAITAENLNDTERVAVIARGIQTYTDRPAEGKPWWYAVVTSSGGETVKLIIPWRNALGIPVTVFPGTQQLSNAAELYSLSAEAAGATVSLNYDADRPGREIAIFRSTGPMNTLEAIDHAVKVGSSTAQYGGMEDSPLPGITWYYTAVDTGLIESGYPDWFEKAAFSSPITLSLGETRIFFESSIRPAPLPLLRRREMPDRAPISAEATAALSATLDPVQGRLWVQPEPEILDIDRGNTDNRRQQILKEILEDSFANQNWTEANEELFALSATNGLDDAAKARILFYRGQCQYYLDDLRSAFLSFLVASDYYYPESRKWMLRIYGDLTPVS